MHDDSVLSDLRKPRLQDVLKILVIRFARLGDVILLVPALRALRRRFPNSQIDVLVDSRFADILHMCSAVSNVITLNRIALRDQNKWRSIASIVRLTAGLRKQRYDVVLDCHSFRETHLLTWLTGARWRQGLKRVHSEYLSFCFNRPPVIEDDAAHVSEVFLSMMKPLGCRSLVDDHLIDLPTSERNWANQFFLGSSRLPGVKWLVGLYIGAGSSTRTWPVVNFARLGSKILRKPGAGLILFCGPDEEQLLIQCRSNISESERVVCAPNLSLPKLAALLTRCSVLVSNDTGPMHLGSASGVPTLGLFSIARPEHYHPLGSQARFIKRAAIDLIEVETVFEQLEQILNIREPIEDSQN